jgi:glycogen debranching enzyme
VIFTFMNFSRHRRNAKVGILFASVSFSSAMAQAGLDTIPRFALSEGPLAIRQAVQPHHPFTVTGATGAILGLQNGSVEMWALPTKVFSSLHLTAELEGHSVPIDLNEAVAAIDVQPDHTTITYSHAAITVRQHMFVPAGEDNPAKGPIIFFEIESIKPAVLTISLEPAMVQQWPAPSFGRPSASWVSLGSGGVYVLSTDNPVNFGIVGMPNATAGTMAPYQERPRALPLEFKVHFDPKADAGHFFPLIAEVSNPGERNSDAAVSAMQARLIAKANALPEIYRLTRTYYEHFFDQRLTVHTPDPHFDAAIRWAEIAIEQAKVKTGDETGLVAGWYPSFDSTRPGFGWYFGRDTLWSLYAVNSYGDAALAKQALEFLARRQRDDGKMMHEYPLTAALLQGDMEWSKLGYEYAAADSTPLFIMAVADYVRATGDVEFLRAHWEQLKKAYAFARAHESDGVFDNSQGTGWVEAWPPKMPHQEIYLASLDLSSTATMAGLAKLMQDEELASSATAQAQHIGDAVAKYRQNDGMYAFSRNRDGSYDTTVTVFPSVALWVAGSSLPKPEAMLSAWASHDFSTDWGVRSVSGTAAVFDPISYHQGSVWPLFTGWASLAQYREGRPLAGYAALMRNLDLTWAQDPGFVTEVISGEFYQPLGRSSSHQLWSSAMVLTPAIRGLFGVEADALHRTLRIRPHLPAEWDFAELNNVRVGDDLYTVTLKREQDHLLATVRSSKETVLCLSNQATAGSEDCYARAAVVRTLSLALPAVEVSLDGQHVAAEGAVTSQARVIEESYDAHGVTLTMEGVGGTAAELSVRRNSTRLQRTDTSPLSVNGAKLDGEKVKVIFPKGPGFTSQRIQISWR